MAMDAIYSLNLCDAADADLLKGDRKPVDR